MDHIFWGTPHFRKPPSMIMYVDWILGILNKLEPDTPNKIDAHGSSGHPCLGYPQGARRYHGFTDP